MHGAEGRFPDILLFLSVQKSSIFELRPTDGMMQIYDLRKSFEFLKTVNGFTFHIGLIVKKAVKNSPKERWEWLLLIPNFTKDIRL